MSGVLFLCGKNVAALVDSSLPDRARILPWLLFKIHETAGFGFLKSAQRFNI